jgi:hypothetical protein
MLAAHQAELPAGKAWYLILEWTRANRQAGNQTRSYGEGG